MLFPPLAKGLTLEGRTDGRNGCMVRLFDEDHKEMWLKRYDYMSDGINYQSKMASHIAEQMNVLFELMGLKENMDFEELLPITKIIRAESEKRYGNPLPNSDYEVRVIFQ